MSGHNPHSHLSQPNSSWNPLQIPSYIPRQPQLAHMSNERPLVRSPLTWHAPAPPTPPEAFYSFLSANHKNLELNPLLPSFVRGPPPFGSVDLTIQSARNSTTPSPRNLASSPPTQEFPAHKQPQQQPFQAHHQHPHNPPQIPRSLTPNNLNNSSMPPSSGPGVIQSTGSVRDKFQCSTSNGNNNGELPQPPPTGNIFIRDARQINSDIAKITAREPVSLEVNRNISPLPLNEPVELIRENPYQPVKSHAAVPTSPKRLSPARPPSISNCTPMSPRSRSPLTTLINTGLTADVVNNHVIKSSGNGINLTSTQKSELAATTISSENSPLSLALPPSPTTTTSNEDSVDSQTSKSRRKRKPNKTTRVSNDSDESMHERENEAVSLKPALVPNEQPQMNFIPEKEETLIDLDTNKLISSNKSEPVEVINSNKTTCQSDSQQQDSSADATAIITPRVSGEAHAETPAEVFNSKSPEERHNSDAINGESPPSIEEAKSEEPNRPLQPSSPPEEPQSVIVNNTSASTTSKHSSNSPPHIDHSNANIINDCQKIESPPTSTPLSNQEQDIKSQTENPEEISTGGLPLQQASVEDSLDSPRKRCKRKGDSDDIETIDKIAAMIASTQENEEANGKPNVDSLEVLTKVTEEPQEKATNESVKVETKLEEAHPQNSNSKINDLAEILETPSVGCSPKDTTDSTPTIDAPNVETKNVEENCFEEVENKLEEMFAGIEDGEPPPCILPAPTIDEPITPEVISELGLGGLSSPQKQAPIPPILSTPSEEVQTKSSPHKDENSSKSSNHHNSSQKRSHNNNKAESTPPNKKRKVSKKSTQSSSSLNQKSSTSSSSASAKPSKSHPTSTSTSHSSKSTKSTEKQPTTNSTKDSKPKDEPATVEYKGPFIQVKSDGTINVINAPTTEDVVEKQNKVKKSIHNHSHSDRNKIRGLHVSTLSTKYDADTTDTTWMCVFCKRGPHKLGLGDLFGPYIVTTTCEGFAYSQKDPNDDEFISRRTKADMFQKQVNGMPVVPASTSSLATITSAASIASSSSSSSTSKKKRKTNDSPSILQNSTLSTQSASPSFDINDIYVGMSKVSETSYEVWVHEDCVVWSSGVYIIGARIVGLDTAVWSSTRYKCSICSKNGAMISCLQRGCAEKAHISCARTQGWDLNENEFKSTCEKHSILSKMSS